MKIKIFLLSIVLCISVALTGCSYSGFEKTIQLFKERIEKILNFNKDAPQDYLSNFKTSLNSGKPFTLTKIAQTEYSETHEEIYFAGEYIYKISKVLSGTPFTAHKLYKASGESYSYNGNVVTQDKTVDFASVKNEILNDLFGDDIAWQNDGGGYSFSNGDYNYYIEKGETENSLEYEIRYQTTDTLAVYKGKVTLIDSLIVDIPEPLKKYL